MSEMFQSKQSTVNGIHKIDTTQSPMNGVHKTNDNSSRPVSTSHAAIYISSGSETSENPLRTHQARRILPWSTDRAASKHTQRKREELVQKHRQVAQQDASVPHDRSTVIPSVRNEANLPTRSIGPAIAREAFDKSTDEAKVSSNPVVEKQPQHLNSLLVGPSVTQAATGSLEPIRPASEHQGSTSITLSNNAKPPTDLSMSEAERNVASILKRKRSKTTQRPAEDQPNKKQAVSVKSPLSQLPIAAVPVPTKEPNKCGASQLARQLVNGAKPDGRERAQPNHTNAKATVSSEDAATLRSEANKAAEPVPTNGNPGEGRPVQPHEPQVVERQLPKDGGSRSPQTTFPNDLTGGNLGEAKPAVAFRTVTSPGKAEADNPAVNVGLAQPKSSPEVNQIDETKQGVSSRSAAVVATPNGLGLANPSSLPFARREQDQRVKTLDTSQNTGTPGVENSSKVADLSETASALQVRSIPLSLSEVEAVLRKHINTSQDDHEYFVKGWLRRARLDGLGRPPNTGIISIVDDANNHGTLPKAKMRPSFPSIPSHGSSSVTKKLEFEMIDDNPYFKGSKLVNEKSRSKNPKEVSTEITTYSTTRYSTDAVDVPQHDTYVSLKRNILGENRKRLRYVPYLEDSDDNDRAANEGLERRLRKMYDFTPNEQRPGFVRHSEKARKLGPYVEAFLEELGCNFSDVLHFLLAPKDSDYDQSLGEDTVRAYKRRADSCTEKFNRESRKWVRVLKELPALTGPKKLAIAALACSAFLNVCRYSLWHVARKASCAVLPVSSSEQCLLKACRVCFLFDCQCHGEMKEEEHSGQYEWLSDDELAAQINRRTNVHTCSRRVEHSDDGRVSAIEDGEHNSGYFYKGTRTWELHNRLPFYPCNHPGQSCEAAVCRCFEQQITCEKSCACPQTCSRRFKGCTCSTHPTRRVCFQDARCDCFQLNRECDPDFCGSCGAKDLLDPMNRYNEGAVKGKCSNVEIQRGVPKKTLLGNSEFHGFGLYMGEKVKQYQFIGEYKGEIIGTKEMIRREVVYAFMNTWYTFKLNPEQGIDSKSAGNKIRFINNSDVKDTINVHARAMMCNTVVRFGMFAARNIEEGEELFFSYNYPDDVTRDFLERDGGKRGTTQPKKVVKGASASSFAKPGLPASATAKPQTATEPAARGAVARKTLDPSTTLSSGDTSGRGEASRPVRSTRTRKPARAERESSVSSSIFFAHEMEDDEDYAPADVSDSEGERDRIGEDDGEKKVRRRRRPRRDGFALSRNRERESSEYIP